MSDEFGTVNMKSADRAREVELVRKRFRRHREALVEMAADAPTEHLASEYHRLIQNIDIALAKVDEIEGRTTTDTQPIKTAPGTRPLVASPAAAHSLEDEPGSASSRLVLIVIAGLVVLAVIGWMIWRASSDERPATPVVDTVETTETIEEEPVAPPARQQIAALSIEPQAHDYGVVRKGTRAARQFEVVNTTDRPITIQVARSTCRCLYYDYADSIPPKGRETLTVTVDGAKAEAGVLQESVRVTSETDPAVATSFDVTATIQ